MHTSDARTGSRPKEQVKKMRLYRRGLGHCDDNNTDPGDSGGQVAVATRTPQNEQQLDCRQVEAGIWDVIDFE